MEIARAIDKVVGWLNRTIGWVMRKTGNELKWYRFLDNLVLYCAERGALYQYCFSGMIESWKDFFEDIKRAVTRIKDAHADMIATSKTIRSMMMPWGGHKSDNR
jgi:hypothetical protein